MYADAKVSMMRIERLVDDAQRFETTDQSCTPNAQEFAVPKTQELCILAEELSVKRPPATLVITRANLDIQGPGLYLVLGPNAGGKT
jgi:ATPase subunit of ABC transporter with duplicated ATPase domains